MNENWKYCKKEKKIDYEYSEVRQLPVDRELEKIDFKLTKRKRKILQEIQNNTGETISELMRRIVDEFLDIEIATRQFREMDNFYKEGEIVQYPENILSQTTKTN